MDFYHSEHQLFWSLKENWTSRKQRGLSLWGLKLLEGSFWWGAEWFLHKNLQLQQLRQRCNTSWHCVDKEAESSWKTGSLRRSLVGMTETACASCPLLCSSQAACLYKLLSNPSCLDLPGLCACLFADYIAESSTKKPRYLKELYVTKSQTVCQRNSHTH